VLKISPPLGLDSRTDKLVASRDTERAIPAHIKQRFKIYDVSILCMHSTACILMSGKVFRGMAKLSEVACPNCLVNFEEILSRASGKFLGVLHNYY
jgi:hypothetical protein